MRSKKTLIQTFLILTLILLNFVVFNFYYKADFKKDQTDLKNQEIEEKSLNVKNNDLIENLKYTSNNSRGDIYELFADFGEANKENPDIMFLTNVNGRIKSKNKPDVLLTSKFANFNTKTFELSNNFHHKQMIEFQITNRFYSESSVSSISLNPG